MSQIPPSRGADQPDDRDDQGPARPPWRGATPPSEEPPGGPNDAPPASGGYPSPGGHQAPPPYPGYGQAPPAYPGYGQPGYGTPPPYPGYGQPGYGTPPPYPGYGQPGYGTPPPYPGYGHPGYGPPLGQTPPPYGWTDPRFGPSEAPKNGPGSLASYGSRVVAYIVDALIVGIPVGVVTVAGGLDRLAEYSLDAVVAFAYATLLLGGATAQTIGMRVMNIGVADEASRASPIGYGKAAGRTAVALLVNVILLVGPLVDLLWPLWDPMNQTLHDKAAGTIVVRR